MKKKDNSVPSKKKKVPSVPLMFGACSSGEPLVGTDTETHKYGQPQTGTDRFTLIQRTDGMKRDTGRLKERLCSPET